MKHGAAMTHFLFLKPKSVFIQIVPLGTDWAAETYYGEPAKKLGLKYIGYKIMPQESSLYDDYGKDDPVIRDPDSLNDKGWEYTKKNYLQGQNLLDLVEFKLKEVIAREPTLLVMVVGVPNVGKSALINSVHQIAATRFPVQDRLKRATVGPLPGVTQDIAGFKIAHRPSIYVLDSPGVLVPNIPDIETGLKLALSGSVKDSVVGEERLAQYFLAILNTRGTPLHWKYLFEGRNEGSSHQDSIDKPSYNLKDLRHQRSKQPDSSAVHYVGGMISEVQRSLYTTLSEFDGDTEDENDLECLIEQQFEALQKALKVSTRASSEARLMVSKKFLTLFRTGRLGPFILDDVPETDMSL
ncbi:hypothetical protein F2Q68_00023781 [Brassica cretica]|uniref:G domain-containing protein n=1 Tax=Brassica cretica TaxID=69181 RepID=A0A8S9IF38_BRACR|nr:hypothetical protein F2Q68_00023781 [Brassica cretica]